jgi:thiosulfate/3-mercaptopyruvate sulfurtransferase
MKYKGIIASALLAVFVCAPLFPPAARAASSDPLPPVVSTAWLSEQLEDPDLVILHVGAKGSYEEGHLPDARKASLRRLIRVNDAGIRDEMLPAAELSAALGEMGIGKESRVVVCFAHEDAAWAAARYLLTLEYAGLSGRVTFLDGGLPGWKTGGFPVSKDVASFETTDPSVTTADDVIVDTGWLAKNLEQPGITVIDARPAEGYSGVSGHWDRLGHIPGAANIPFFTVLAEDPPYLLKSREELSMLFQKAGAEPGDTVVLYCGTGMWGCLPYLAARHAG